MITNIESIIIKDCIDEIIEGLEKIQKAKVKLNLEEGIDIYINCNKIEVFKGIYKIAEAFEENNVAINDNKEELLLKYKNISIIQSV